MTREEAVKELIRAYDVLDFSCHMDNRRKEAFNMAKVALEQEPKTNKIIDEHYRKGFTNGIRTAEWRASKQETTRPKGKWISYYYGAYYECSNCHERNNSRYDNYCKFCGAEMEGVEE